jgi:hypothetical protein
MRSSLYCKSRRAVPGDPMVAVTNRKGVTKMARGTGAGGTAGRASARSGRPSITIGDLDRVAREVVTGVQTWEWVELEGIEEEAMVALLMSAASAVLQRITSGDDFVDVLNHTVGQTFHLGWEAHRQLGRDR